MYNKSQVYFHKTITVDDSLPAACGCVVGVLLCLPKADLLVLHVRRLLLLGLGLLVILARRPAVQRAHLHVQVLLYRHGDPREQGGIPLELHEPLSEHLAYLHDVTSPSLHVNLL